MKTKDIIKGVNELGYIFQEDDSRMSYGFIGNLIKLKGDLVINIFQNSVYFLKDEAVDPAIFDYIKLIQKKFKNLTKQPNGTYGAHTRHLEQKAVY